MNDLSSKSPAISEASFGLPVAGEVIAGKYRVEKVVGSGGMGIVVSARHLKLGQSVAIKLLLVEGLEDERRAEACARFLREGQSAAGLTSDHVVRIYDVGTTELGAPFMVMELLRGDDLSRVVEREGPAPVEAAVDFVLQACDAVGEAHALGIVHRDLKPSNLFVSQRPDGRTHVKVLDFGISKAITREGETVDGGLTATRTVVGSPYYMSPEQVRDAKRVDGRADIWALGMILYELLVGEPAFSAETLPAICAAIAADTPQPIRERRAEIPLELEAVVMRCLEKDPAKRFQTVSELVQALRPFAPPPGSRTTGEYLSRRNAGLQEVAANSRMTSTLDRLGESGPRAVPSSLLELDDVVPAARKLVHAGKVTSKEPELFVTPSPRNPDLQASHTLLSGSSREGPMASAPTEPAPPSLESRRAPGGRGARALVAVGLAVALIGVGFAVFTGRGSGERRPAPTASTPGGFVLSIDSTPPGAMVVEGDRVLGTTPFTATLDSAVLGAQPKHLLLRKDGYLPYAVEQGPSPGAVHVLATLTPTASASPPAAAPAPAPSVIAPAPPDLLAARRAAAGKPRPAVRAPIVPTVAPKPTAPDIRLER